MNVCTTFQDNTPIAVWKFYSNVNLRVAPEAKVGGVTKMSRKHCFGNVNVYPKFGANKSGR